MIQKIEISYTAQSQVVCWDNITKTNRCRTWPQYSSLNDPDGFRNDIRGWWLEVPRTKREAAHLAFHSSGLRRRSHYDSLQLQISKTSKGLYFGAVYTFSKYMEAVSYLNANDARPERVISSSDRPQRFTVHGIYELPFGPGREFLGNSKGAVRRIAEGLQLLWVATYQVAQPLQFTSAQRIVNPTTTPIRSTAGSIRRSSFRSRHSRSTLSRVTWPTFALRVSGSETSRS